MISSVRGLRVLRDSVVIFALCLSRLAFAEAQIRSAASVLKIVPAPASAAMGDAVFAVPLGLSGFFVNPAVLATSRPGQDVALAHAVWGNEISHDTVSIGASAPPGTFGLALSLFQTGVQERRDLQGFVTGEVRSVLAAVHAGYAAPLTRDLLVGGAVRGLIEKLDDVTWFSAALDLGALWRSPWPGVTAGVTANDLGLPLSGGDPTRYRLPVRFQLGGAWRGLGVPVDLGAGFEYQPTDAATTIHAGGQYRWNVGEFSGALRAGYRHSLRAGFPSGPTAGAGLSFRDATLDYAWVRYPLIGTDTHRIALEYHRGPASTELRPSGPTKFSLSDLPGPERLYALPGIGSLKIAWDPPRARAKIAGYNVYLVDPKTRILRKVNAELIHQTFATFPKVAPGANVEITVAAVLAATEPGQPPIEGRRAAPIKARVRAAGEVPHPPQRLIAGASSGKAILTWLPNEGGDVTGYHVYVSTTESGSFQKLTSKGPVKQPLFTDPDVAPGTPVYYYVTAAGAKGRESAPSEKVRVVP